MPDHHHLLRAPIVEALIFIQANAAAAWDAGRVREHLENILPDHKEVQEMRPIEISVEAHPDKEPEQRINFPGIEGFFFRSKTSPTVYQVRRDGFIFSWLKPYSRWTEFSERALEGWRKYKDFLQLPDPHAVVVRFINRLEFPLEGFRLSRYFKSHPTIPEDLPGWMFGGFSQSFVWVVPDSPCVAQIGLAQVPDPAPDHVAFHLDIEVKLKEPLAASGLPLEAALEEMRRIKNDAFFAMLTSETVERYK